MSREVEEASIVSAQRLLSRYSGRALARSPWYVLKTSARGSVPAATAMGMNSFRARAVSTGMTKVDGLSERRCARLTSPRAGHDVPMMALCFCRLSLRTYP